MTLNANEPTDQRMVSELPYYIRQNRSSINDFEAQEADISTTDLTISGGTTALVVGVDLNNIPIEIIRLTSLGASTLDQIRGGSDGNIKIFIFQDNNVSLLDGPKSDGQFYLNQLPVGSTYHAQRDDVLAIINNGGDGSSEYGYWKELWRQVSVK